MHPRYLYLTVGFSLVTVFKKVQNTISILDRQVHIRSLYPRSLPDSSFILAARDELTPVRNALNLGSTSVSTHHLQQKVQAMKYAKSKVFAARREATLEAKYESHQKQVAAVLAKRKEAAEKKAAEALAAKQEAQAKKLAVAEAKKKEAQAKKAALLEAKKLAAAEKRQAAEAAKKIAAEQKEAGMRQRQEAASAKRAGIAMAREDAQAKNKTKDSMFDIFR